MHCTISQKHLARIWTIHSFKVISTARNTYCNPWIYIINASRHIDLGRHVRQPYWLLAEPRYCRDLERRPDKNFLRFGKKLQVGYINKLVVIPLSPRCSSLLLFPQLCEHLNLCEPFTNMQFHFYLELIPFKYLEHSSQCFLYR